MIHRLLVLLLICCFGSLASQSSNEKLPMTDIEGGNICNVEGVNVISGNYSFLMEPFFIPGPQPVSYQCGYIADLLWKDNLDTRIKMWPQQGKCIYFQFGTGAHFYRNDGFVFYDYFFRDESDFQYEVRMEREGNGGLTNIGQGVISGKTSYRNTVIKTDYFYWSGYATLYNGKGETKSFKRISLDQEPNYGEFMLEKEFKPNGSLVIYEPRLDKMPLRYKMRSTDGCNHHDFAYLEIKKFQDGKPENIVASDGREMKIDYVKKGNHLLPNKILHPNLPAHEFEYYLDKSNNPHLSKIFRGSQKKIELNYYGQENNRHGSVRKISRVIGENLDECDVYNFKYSSNSTTVEDALGYRRIFKYNKDKIEEIKHESNAGTLKYELFKWDEEKLQSKELKNGNQQPIYYQKYYYDNRGNIVKEKIRGVFSGSSSELEQYYKEYTYSEDKFNNLLCAYDGDTWTRYTYKKNTDLCKTEFITHSGNILHRKFREYDSNSTLIKEIIDDGVSEDENNLTEVTFRIIKRYTPKKEIPCMGFPIEVKETYLDLRTGEEKQLKRMVNEYTPEGWLTKQEVYDADDNYCYTLEWEYNRFGKVIREVNPLGYVTIRDYDDYGNMIREEGPKPGHVTLYQYNFLDQPIRKEIQDDSGFSLVETFAYDQMGNRILSRNYFGEETVYKYDSFGRNIEIILPAASRGQLSIKQAFDCMGNVVETTDPLGRKTKKKFNVLGKPVAIVYPDGSFELFQYNFNGTLRSHRDRSDTLTTYRWDCLKQMTSKTVMKNKTLSREAKTYKGFHLIEEEDAEGRVTNYTYDFAGRKIASQKGDHRTTYEYDSLGRISVVKQWKDDENWIATVKNYDFCDRIIEEYQEDSSGRISGITQTVYDEMGNKIRVVSYQDHGLSITETEYNTLNNATKIIDPLGHVTHIDYNYEHLNEYGQRVLQKTTIDPKGVQIVETYDVFNKVVCIEKKDPYGQLLSKVDKAFDLAGNLIKLEQTVVTPGKDDRIVTALMEYSSMDQLTCLIEAAGTKDQKITRYEYTPSGKKEKVIKPSGIELKYTYNYLGLVEKLESLNAPLEASVCYEYTYDKLKNLIAVVDRIHNKETKRDFNDNSEMICEKLGNDLEIRYERDRLGRSVKILYPDNREVEYIYKGGRIEKATYIHGDKAHSAHYQYDICGKINEIALNGGNEPYHLKFYYDLKGQETARDTIYWNQTHVQYDEKGHLTFREVTDYWGSTYCDYTYDKLDQLTKEQGLAFHTYTHDSNNNRVNCDDEEVMINDLNQVLFAKGKTYTYDSSGNLISDTSARYFYDALDRLITVIKNEEKYRYIYDAQNRRIAKQKYRKTNEGWFLETTIKFLYQNNCEVGSVEGNTITTFRPLGEGLGAEIGSAFAIEIKDDVYLPFYDQVGNLVTLVDAQTNEIAFAARYSAFGQLEKSYGQSPPYLFSSKRYDPETGWIYFGNRYYDPDLGRWTTCDPAGYSDGYNLYAYVHNSPLVFIDKFGLFRGHNTKREKEYYNSEAYKNGQCYKCWSRDNPIIPQVTYRNYEHRFQKTQPSRAFTVGDIFYDNFGISLTNGICTEFDTCYNWGSGISQAFDGAAVRGIHNATHGFLWDMYESALGLYYKIATDPVKKIQAGWDEFFKNKGPDAILLQICHSQGSINTRNALLSYPEELRQRIVVISVGPAAYIYKQTCKEVTHLVSKNDPVTLLDWKGRCRERDTIKFLEPSPGSIFDHSLENQAYKKALQQQLNEFQKRYGESIW